MKRRPQDDTNIPQPVDDETGDASSPRPDGNLVDEIGEEVGVQFDPAEPLRPIEKVGQRDRDRWELNPSSSEDYEDRVHDTED